MPFEFRIGCSGYYYPNWRRIFYPKDVSGKNWLQYYSTIFNSVELNGTFYRTPELKSLIKNATATAKDFLFSAKMSRYITHTMKLKDCAEQIREFQDLLLQGFGDKMGCFLFQMPPSFHYNDENLERILSQVPRGEQNVVELRHLSWWNENTTKQFKKAGITFCNVDFPGLQTYFIHTTTTFYMRFHGTPVLFHSNYKTEQLLNFKKEFPATAGKNFIYFNNTAHGHAFRNAQELMQLLNIDRSVYRIK